MADLLLLGDGEIRSLIGIEQAVAGLTRAYEWLANGSVTFLPRSRVEAPAGRTFHSLVAVLSPAGVAGAKLALTEPGRSSAITVLYRLDDAAPVALLESGYLSLLRTTATSLLAARHLARPGSSRLAVLGSGRQALGQVKGFCEAFPIRSVSVWSPNPIHRTSFAATVATLGVESTAAGTAAAAVAGADIVVTATRSTEAVLHADCVEAGMHINAIGADRSSKRELAADLLARADLIITDSLEQARTDAGDLIAAAAEGAIDWNHVEELSALITGAAAPRSSDRQLTVFNAQGTALGDIALAELAYRTALESGVGQPVRF